MKLCSRTFVSVLCLLSMLGYCACISAPRPVATDGVGIDIRRVCGAAVQACVASGDASVCEAALACNQVGRAADRLQRQLMACEGHADVDGAICRGLVFKLENKVSVLERERWYWAGALVLEAAVIVLLSVLK